MIRPLTLAALLFLSASGLTEAAEVRLQGFASVTAGYVSSGRATPGQYPAGTDTPYDYQPNPDNGEIRHRCPCFVANFERAGLYEYRRLDLGPETHFGVQADFTVTPRLSATVQMAGRGSQDFEPELDWAYASYVLTPEWTLQAGHKRLPLFYYSEYLYVGFAYPWVRPPQQLYGWQIYDYEGANLLYRRGIGDWNLTASLWAGNQRDRDSEMLEQIYYGMRIDEHWKNIVGGYLDVSNEVVNLRVIGMHTSVERYGILNGTRERLLDDVEQEFYGLAFNADYRGWLWRSELNRFYRPELEDRFIAVLASAGYRFGALTPVLGWANFDEDFENNVAEDTSLYFATLRWDIDRNMAVKLQFDRMRDRSSFPYTGDADLITVSWNLVF